MARRSNLRCCSKRPASARAGRDAGDRVHGTADEAVNPLNGRLLARQFLAYNGLADKLDQRLESANDAMALGPTTALVATCALAAGIAIWSDWWK
jgi:hypothetical protein